jgi:transposase InsO family protein
MYRVGIDLIEAMTDSVHGNTYALVLVDYATRFPDVLPLPSKDAKTVAAGLMTMFTRWEYPKEVLSDQGSQFLSQLFADLFYNAGIAHLVATEYAPSTNGLVERFNKTLKMMIMKFAEGHKENWDEKIDAFLLHIAQFHSPP